MMMGMMMMGMPTRRPTMQVTKKPTRRPKMKMMMMMCRYSSKSKGMKGRELKGKGSSMSCGRDSWSSSSKSGNKRMWRKRMQIQSTKLTTASIGNMMKKPKKGRSAPEKVNTDRLTQQRQRVGSSNFAENRSMMHRKKPAHQGDGFWWLGMWVPRR
jgi:hypothetical protein